MPTPSGEAPPAAPQAAPAPATPAPAPAAAPAAAPTPAPAPAAAQPAQAQPKEPLTEEQQYRQDLARTLGHPPLPYPPGSLMRELGIRAPDWFEICQMYLAGDKIKAGVDTAWLVKLLYKIKSDNLSWKDNAYYFDPRGNQLNINKTIGYWRVKAIRTGTYVGLSFERGGEGEHRWSKATIIKIVSGHPAKFEGDKVVLSQAKGSGGSTWKNMPDVMLDKRAEAGALRKAYTHDEPSPDTQKAVADLTINAMENMPVGFGAPNPIDANDALPETDSTEYPGADEDPYTGHVAPIAQQHAQAQQQAAPAAPAPAPAAPAPVAEPEANQVDAWWNAPHTFEQGKQYPAGSLLVDSNGDRWVVSSRGAFLKNNEKAVAIGVHRIAVQEAFDAQRSQTPAPAPLADVPIADFQA